MKEKDYFSPIQLIRIGDVLIVGPVMIFLGRKVGGGWGTLLIILGILTILFNWYNYFLNIEKE